MSVDKCPTKVITTQSRIYLQAFSYYKDGFLPQPGTVFEQGNKVMEAIKFIDAEVARIGSKK